MSTRIQGCPDLGVFFSHRSSDWIQKNFAKCLYYTGNPLSLKNNEHAETLRLEQSPSCNKLQQAVTYANSVHANTSKAHTIRCVCVRATQIVLGCEADKLERFIAVWCCY